MEEDYINNIPALKNLKELTEKRGYKPEDKDYFQKVYDFLKKNKHDTSRLEEKLDDLLLVQTTEESYGYIGAHYDEKNNKIVYQNEEDLYHETFHVATKGIVLIPKTGGKVGESLNEGITDLFTKKIGKDIPTNYHFERICAGAIEKAYGKRIFDAYFEGSGLKFASQFDEELILYLYEDLDDYSKAYRDCYQNLRPNLEANEEMATRFYDVITDLVDLCQEGPKGSLKDVLNYLEKEFKKPEMKPIIEGVELGSGYPLDIKSKFDIENIRK